MTPTSIGTALVVGAGRGIGRGVVLALSERGYRVAGTARTAAELDTLGEELAGEFLAVPADVCDAAAAETVCGTVEEAYGPIDVLVVAAGSARTAPLHRTTDEDWAAMLEVHVSAPFRFLRRLAPAMRSREHGRIVLVSSVAGRQGEPYVVAYTAAKHGVIGLMRSAAAEFARTGVTVNAVCPGYVDTPMTEQSVAAIVERTGREVDEVRHLLADRQGNGRLVRVAEVCDTVLLCIDNPALNGQAIVLDGGRHQR